MLLGCFGEALGTGDPFVDALGMLFVVFVDAFWMLFGCFLDAFWMLLGCFGDATECIGDVLVLLLGLEILLAMFLEYFGDVFWMHFEQFSFFY